MRQSAKRQLCLWALLFLALAGTALANDVTIVRDPAPLAAEEITAVQPTDGSRATYDGTLRVYIVEPLSPRWRDDDNRQYEQAFLDWSTVDTISVPDGGTYYSIATWTAPSAYSNITEDNIAAIGVVFNAEDTVLDAYPGYGYWFTAHFADGCAYATPGLTGYNSTDHGTTHTVFIEEGTACWCGYCPTVRAALSSIHASGTYNFEYAALVAQQTYGGAAIQPAYNRLSNDYNLAGFPTCFLDGGYEVLVGAYGVSTYQSWINNLAQRTVPPLEIMTAIEWLGSATIKTHVRIANGTSVNSEPTGLVDPVIPTVYMIGTDLNLETYATDADDDSLFYQWDIQGPETYTSDWLGPFPQGEMATYVYSFEELGDYTVSVRAKEVWGAITDWSTPQTITISCCDHRADINGSGSGPDISDLVYMVTYMFSQGPEPVCLEAANINGQGADAPDIADLVYLVTFMFSSGPDPAPCALQE